MDESEPNHDTNRARTDGGTTQAREAMHEAGTTDGVPEGAIASVEDFAHQRDGRGAILPVAEPVPGTAQDCAACGGEGVVLVPDETAGLGEADGPESEPCPTCAGQGETPKYVRVRPITQGEANRVLPDDGNVSKLDDDEIFGLIQEFYVEPNFEKVESLDDIGAFSLDPLLMALMNASGFDMAQGMISENSDLMAAVEGNSSRGN